MNKKLLLLLIVILSFGFVQAQNANRSGIFLELGAGGLIGSTPRKSLSIVDDVMYFKYLSGPTIDCGVGGRLRMNNHWAYELKIDAMLPVSSPINNMILRCLPLGFRYTSQEIWKNNSLYGHVNVGVALAANRGIINYEGIENKTYYYNTPEREIKGFSSSVGLGVAYSLGFGVNITTHFYTEACWKGQTIFDSFVRNGRAIANYGTLGIIFGYRF